MLQNRLVAALGTKDPALLERAARRLGISGMARALDSNSRRITVAVLRAAPLLDKAWVLLPRIVGQMMRPGADRSLATLAGAASLAIAEGMRRPDLERTEEIPALLKVSQMLVQTAGNRQISLDVRVRALLARAHLSDLLPQPPGSRNLIVFLSDPEPRIREVAVELFAVAMSPVVFNRLARMVVEEQTTRVARAAAVALCARVSPRGKRPQPALSALRAAKGAHARIRQLVESLDASDDQLVDLSRCLARSRSPEDQQALRQLRRRSRRMRRLLR